MKTSRLLALLALAVLAACADPITAPAATPEAEAQTSTGQGLLGGGTR